ncbi:MAG TPA: 3D domain-containing protein [Gaiellaceae bacterium]
MLGQAHTLRRRLVPLAVAAVAIPAVLLALADVGGADPSQSAQALRALDAQLEAKQRSAVLDLYALDRQLAASRARLDALHAQARALRAQRAVLGKELTVARSGTRIAQDRLSKRLLALYEQRKPTPIEILFGARSLDQALSDLDSLSSASAQSEAILRQVHAAKRHLSAVGRTLAARSAALAGATRRAEATTTALAATRARRSTYISQVAAKRRLTERQVSTLVAQARAAAARSAALERASTRSVDAVTAAPPAPVYADSAGPAAPGGRELTVTATGYSLGGTTATGLPVGWGIAAVDPAVIPLGTHMVVPGYGEAVAADTGGAVVGADIDLWFPTASQAAAWGRRTVTIELP